MLKILSSVRITVICLLLLFILTFWGTIAQISQGLYAAQERFFASFFFLAGGWLPFPGAQLVLWVLFINLVASLIEHFNKRKEWTYVGSKIVHLGLILYFVSAFCIFHLSKESYVHLMEGSVTNVSTAYSEWELAFWQGQKQERDITAIDSKNFKGGWHIPFQNLDFNITVVKYCPNSDDKIDPKPLEKDRESNFAGGVFNLEFDGQNHQLVLFGAHGAQKMMIHGREYHFALRRKHDLLPFIIRLDKFNAAFHPGTQIAKSYESWVTISTNRLTRQVRIYMNNPLRYKDYTLYQASYDTDSLGRQYSTFAVVKNSARVLPYISCLMVFLGLALHFLIQAFASRNK